MFFSDSDILRHVGSRAMEAGRIYHRQGRVLSLEEHEQEIDAVVRGSARQPYSVKIVLTREGSGVRIKGSCTCPVGAYCKHIAAALLESRARFPTRAVTPSVAANPSSWPAPAMPAADDSLPPPLAYWLEALQRAQDAATEDYPKDVQQRLLYVFKVSDHPNATPQLGLETVSARMLKDGSFSTSVSRPALNTLMSDNSAKYIRPSDQRIARQLNLARGYSYESAIKLKDETAWEIIDAALATGRARLESQNGPVLTQGPSLAARIAWKLGEDANLRPVLEIDNGLTAFVASPPGYIDRTSGAVGRLEVGLEPKLAAKVLDAPPVPVRHAAAFAAAMERRAPRAALARPVAPAPPLRVETPPTPVLRLYRADLPVARDAEGSPNYYYNAYARQPATEPVGLGRLSFRYGPAAIEHGETKPVVVTVSDGRVLEIVRSPQSEDEAVALLAAHGLAEAAAVRHLTPQSHKRDFMPEDDDFGWFDIIYFALPELRERGFVIEVDEDFPHRLLRGEGQVEAEIRESSGIDWFELDLGVMIDGERIDLVGPICRLIASPDFDVADYEALGDSDEPIYLPLPGGRHLALPAARLKPMLEALYELSCGAALADPSGKLRFAMADAAALATFEDATLSAGLIWRGGEALRDMGRTLRATGGVPRVTPPAGFAADLRPYQADGLSWLSFLRQVGLGGILADDMGLGKTVQALALILLEKAEGRLDLPALVVAPTSLMANWRAEAVKFAPDLKVLTLQGLDRKGKFDAIGASDLVLTTYPLIGRDKDVLAARRWSLMILDEAQTIKNPEATTTRIIRDMTARHRFALTGTPLENHLGELWSLFTAVSPGFLGDKAWFTHAFRTPIEKKGDKERARHLARRIKPFLLRRTKEEVASELPPKTEIVERIDMAREQRDLYESIRLAMHEKVRSAIAAKGLNRSRIVVLDALLKMRQACCDPRLLKLAGKSAAKAGSAKLDRLEEILTELIEEDRRILVFSQFTSMLDLIRPRLDRLNFSYSLLTGDTKDRPREIRTFQNGEAKIFLISLKAGGVGLNLTAADTVILYDPWWNPAVEEQAIDRAHRIGQDKPVFVHKLVMTGTIEEKMEQLKEKKRALAESLFDAEGAPTLAMTEADIEMLFSGDRG